LLALQLVHGCSKWFADDIWAALPLPDAWLHDMYQLALMPVRVLWHMWPKYKVRPVL
jgi:hypothetical protein